MNQHPSNQPQNNRNSGENSLQQLLALNGGKKHSLDDKTPVQTPPTHSTTPRKYSSSGRRPIYATDPQIERQLAQQNNPDPALLDQLLVYIPSSDEQEYLEYLQAHPPEDPL